MKRKLLQHFWNKIRLVAVLIFVHKSIILFEFFLSSRLLRISFNWLVMDTGCSLLSIAQHPSDTKYFFSVNYSFYCSSNWFFSNFLLRWYCSDNDNTLCVGLFLFPNIHLRKFLIKTERKTIKVLSLKSQDTGKVLHKMEKKEQDDFRNALVSKRRNSYGFQKYRISDSRIFHASTTWRHQNYGQWIFHYQFFASRLGNMSLIEF